MGYQQVNNMTWKEEIKKAKGIPKKPVLALNKVKPLNKVKHYVDGIIYIMSEEKEGKKVGKYEEFLDVEDLAKLAINLLEKFTDRDALNELYRD